MFKSSHASSLVTAILPKHAASDVTAALRDKMNIDVLSWDARGTLLLDQWWKRWVPPISPQKVALQLLAPSHDVDTIERTIIETARLDKQSTGAVFSSPCSQAYFGEDFNAWQVERLLSKENNVTTLNANRGITLDGGGGIINKDGPHTINGAIRGLNPATGKSCKSIGCS